MIGTSLSDVMHIVGKLIEFSFQRYASQSSKSENDVKIMIQKLFDLEHLQVNWFPIDQHDLSISNFQFMIVTSFSDVENCNAYRWKENSISFPTICITSDNDVTIMNRIFEIDKSRWSIGLPLTHKCSRHYLTLLKNLSS